MFGSIVGPRIDGNTHIVRTLVLKKAVSIS